MAGGMMTRAAGAATVRHALFLARGPCGDAHRPPVAAALLLALAASRLPTATRLARAGPPGFAAFGFLAAARRRGRLGAAVAPRRRRREGPPGLVGHGIRRRVDHQERHRRAGGHAGRARASRSTIRCTVTRGRRGQTRITCDLLAHVRLPWTPRACTRSMPATRCCARRSPSRWPRPRASGSATRTPATSCSQPCARTRPACPCRGSRTRSSSRRSACATPGSARTTRARCATGPTGATNGSGCPATAGGGRTGRLGRATW
jgi:hypothetical protein